MNQPLVSFVAMAALSILSSEASAQVAPASDAMTRYEALTSVAPKPCSKATDMSEIVVCASKLRESQRVPYIEETRIGDRPRLAPGELPRAGDSAAASAPCPPRGCPGNGSVLGAVGKLIERIRD